MTQKQDDKEARLAEALRENLKKRKKQRADAAQKTAEPGPFERQFRVKPIKPRSDV